MIFDKRFKMPYHNVLMSMVHVKKALIVFSVFLIVIVSITPCKAVKSIEFVASIIKWAELFGYELLDDFLVSKKENDDMVLSFDELNVIICYNEKNNDLVFASVFLPYPRDLIEETDKARINAFVGALEYGPFVNVALSDQRHIIEIGENILLMALIAAELKNHELSVPLHTTKNAEYYFIVPDDQLYYILAILK